MKIIDRILDRIFSWLADRIIHADNSGGPNEPLAPPQPLPTQTITFARLRPDLIAELERRLGQPYVSPTTTDLMAGYALGVQATLKQLRDGYATYES